MSDKQISRVEREAQAIKKAALFVGALIILLVLGALSVMLNRYMEKMEWQDKSHIYGEWIEQGVPKFARDRFVVRADGIYINERIVDTQYTFNGRELRYEYEEKQYVYKVKDDEATVLQRVAPTHYLSTFKLQGSESSEDVDEQAEQAESN